MDKTNDIGETKMFAFRASVNNKKEMFTHLQSLREESGLSLNATELLNMLIIYFNNECREVGAGNFITSQLLSIREKP